MRVSTSQIYNIADIGMRDAQSAVNKTSEQISTGKRVLSPADDPVAAVTILRLTQNLGRLEQYEKNINAAENSLDQEEVALEAVVNVIQRIKELTVRAGNTGTLNASNYKALAAEVDTRIEELLNLQNSRNASGQYMFGGHQGGEAPFVDEGQGNFTYQGDEGQLNIQLSESVTIPVSDSGKRLFVDVPSGHNTFNTRANSDNLAVPPAKISVGRIVDQEAFDKFSPRGMEITFNAPENVTPAAANYTITDDKGRVLVENAPYQPGEPIELNGIQFTVSGQPYSGEAAVPSSLDFGTVTATDFSASPETITFSVGGKTETLVLDQAVNNAADLAAALSSTVGGNADKLANLGITVDTTGLQVPNGQNLTVRNGTANTDAAFGFTTQNAGTTATNGELAVPGDGFQVRSTDKQGLLTTLSRFSEALHAYDGSDEGKENMRELVAKTLTNLDTGLDRVSEVQGEIGARLNTLESVRNLNSDTKLQSEELLSQVRDVDVAEASTRLQMQSFILSAAQQTFVKVSNLNLFNFL
jgi:flagellar hook-associated protein 3 FlgL